MLAELMRKMLGKPAKTPEPLPEGLNVPQEITIPLPSPSAERQRLRTQPFGPIAEHAPEEPYRQFKAADRDEMLTGVGSVWANGDAVIQWHQRGHLEIPAGNDFERYVVEWMD